MDSPGVADNPKLAGSDAQRLAELAALVDAVKDRVRSQYPESTGNGGTGAISVGLPDLTPLARARDAAAGKMAAIGSVNPRAGGLVNSGIQAVKKTVSRALNWFVRDQVTFNRQMIACIETCIESLAEVNRTIHNLAGQANTQIRRRVRIGKNSKRNIHRTLSTRRVNWTWSRKRGKEAASVRGYTATIALERPSHQRILKRSVAERATALTPLPLIRSSIDLYRFGYLPSHRASGQSPR